MSPQKMSDEVLAQLDHANRQGAYWKALAPQFNISASALQQRVRLHRLREKLPHPNPQQMSDEILAQIDDAHRKGAPWDQLAGEHNVGRIPLTSRIKRFRQRQKLSGRISEPHQESISIEEGQRKSENPSQSSGLDIGVIEMPLEELLIRGQEILEGLHGDLRRLTQMEEHVSSFLDAAAILADNLDRAKGAISQVEKASSFLINAQLAMEKAHAKNEKLQNRLMRACLALPSENSLVGRV